MLSETIRRHALLRAKTQALTYASALRIDAARERIEESIAIAARLEERARRVVHEVKRERVYEPLRFAAPEPDGLGLDFFAVAEAG